MMGKYPCQQLFGGHPDHVKSGVDEYGLCNHAECQPDDYDVTETRAALAAHEKVNQMLPKQTSGTHERGER